MWQRTKSLLARGVDAFALRAGLVRPSGLRFRRIDDRKVFCIGRNKTGTTSLKVALAELGYIVGEQRKAERLIDAYARRDFQPIIEYCRTAEAFQDVPFSLPFTYVALDQAYPGSKYILSVRNSSEEWYRSYAQFQRQRFGLQRLPLAEELRKDDYVYEGWSYDAMHIVRPRAEDKLHEKEAHVALYETHNEQVKTYFAHRPEDLLVLNVAAPNAYAELCAFLDREPVRQEMPWKNKTHD